MKDPTDDTEQVILHQQQRLTDELVSYAAMLTMSEALSSEHGEYWISTSKRVSNIFQIDTPFPETTMQGFIDLYLQHFWPLWPVLAKQNLDVNRLHPLLYLVLSSIGAMYGGPGSICFGRMMHNKVRTYLTVAFELDDSDGDFIWLAQARLYTQVATLYFGQPRAFTYAQHIGALLMAQGRKIELFSAEQAERAQATFASLQGATGRDAERLAIWLRLEARRRLAFGIFRADTYTSVLLGTRPLLSLDEIDLSFPHCDAIWRAPPMPVDACLHMIDHDRTPSRKLRASDIYCIALDPDEALPVLDPIAHELLQFGLQRPLGRFAHGSSTMERLADPVRSEQDHQSAVRPSPRRVEHTRLSCDPSHAIAPVTCSLSLILPETHRPSVPTRKMSRVTQEYNNMLQSQRKWEARLSTVKTFVTGPSDRSSLMSSLVLFHLGFLRLQAPISKLHQVQYKVVEGRHNSIDPALTESTRTWALSEVAKLAAQRSCDLYALVASEAFSADPERVKFNLLAFIGLHHAVVILWSFVGISREARDVEGEEAMHIMLADGTRVPILESNSRVIMQAFVDLFQQVSPGSWSSFTEAARALALKPFPGCTNNDPSGGS